MGTGGGVSAFAAVHGEADASESPSHSSIESTEAPPCYNENSFLALSDHSGTLPVGPRSVVKLGIDSVTVRLGKGENVVVVGLYSLWVKRGEVSLLGASLRASSTLHHVSVPVTHAIPSITAISDLVEVVISTDDRGIRYLGDVSPHFAGIWEPTSHSTWLSFHVLGYHSKSIQEVSKELRRLALEHWLPSIRRLLRQQRTTTPKVLVSGAKGTGKSTLCRVLVNTMLTMNVNAAAGVVKAFPDGVILLDIDPGQPELAAPGSIYIAHLRAPLLGPPFANMVLPESPENVVLRMHYIGAYTPRESPSHYQRCVSDLLSLHRDYATVPLIINTCGWNTGSGKSLLLSAVQSVSLTDIIHVGDTQNAPFHDLMQPGVGEEQINLSQIPSQPNRTPLKSSRDLRDMQLQVYMHASGIFSGRILWDQLPVTISRGSLPGALDISKELFMIVVLGQDIVPEYISEALNGSVTAIVVIKHDSPLHGLLDGLGERRTNVHAGMRVAYTADSQLPYLEYRNMAGNPLDPETTECIGLGLVTVVPPEDKQLCIKSPVSAAHIKAEIAKGYRIAFVLAQQQGLWSTLESILAREIRPR